MLAKNKISTHSTQMYITLNRIVHSITAFTSVGTVLMQIIGVQIVVGMKIGREFWRPVCNYISDLFVSQYQKMFPR